MNPQKIAIIGAGTAGLATASFLSQQRHKVTLFEKAHELKPVGAGLLLQPSGLEVLAALDASAEILRFGHRIDSLQGLNSAGRKVMNIHYKDMGQALHGLGVHRTTLCHALEHSLRKFDHDRLFNADIKSVDRKASYAIVQWQRDGQTHESAFDAVIIANGSASQLRPRQWVHYDRPYPWGAMWTIQPITSETEALNCAALQQQYRQAQIMIGILPTGSTPLQPEQPLISMFWSLPVSEIPKWQSGQFDFEQWKEKVTQIWPALHCVIEQSGGSQQWLAACYRDVIMNQWGEGRVGVIGDAAHAMSPQLGQGANMALLDAWALAKAMSLNYSDWNLVWRQYSALRGGSIRFYQIASRLLTPFFQSNSRLASLIRDYTMPTAHHIPWLRSQMCTTIAGTKNGFL